VGQAAKKDIDRLEFTKSRKGKVRALSKVRMSALNKVPRKAFRAHLRDFDFRMRKQKPQQLASGVA